LRWSGTWPAGQLFHQRADAAHVLHLFELVAHVVEVELLALATFSASLRLVLVDLLLDLLDQREHVAHAEDARGTGWNTSSRPPSRRCRRT
jgi:hypothetical protein